MKQKRLAALLLAVVMAVTMLAGCGGQQTAGSKKQNDKIQLSFYAWDRSMFKELTPWLEEQFPNIEFTFIQSFNTILQEI